MNLGYSRQLEVCSLQFTVGKTTYLSADRLRPIVFYSLNADSMCYGFSSLWLIDHYFESADICTSFYNECVNSL
jgi:hypothetical protein